MIEGEVTTQLTTSPFVVKTLEKYLKPRGYDVKVDGPTKTCKFYKVMYRKIR